MSLSKAAEALSVVSKWLNDKYITELRFENALMSRRMTRVLLGVDVLNKQLTNVNEGRLFPVCRCMSCFFGKRFDGSVTAPEEIPEIFGGDNWGPCIILTCLVLHARKLGLEVTEKNLGDHESLQAYRMFSARHDCHLVVFTQYGHWWVEYGARLGAEADGETLAYRKVEALIDLIGMDEFFVDGDRDYIATL
jgi:hypothetical protein